MSIVIEIDGKYGGFYVYRSSTSKRICLGFIAVTVHPDNIYDHLKAKYTKGTK